jgi:hypothetical protein
MRILLAPILAAVAFATCVSGCNNVSLTVLKIEDIAQQYQDDADAANKKFLKKRLEVTGVVREVTPTRAEAYVKLDGTDGTDEVASCRFPSHDEVKNLEKGATITFRGNCMGINNKGHVGFNRCVLVQTH